MIKRIICLILAIILVLGLAVTGIASVMGEPLMTTSAEAIALLKKEEGFSRVPYWDYSQWTIGFGTACPEAKRAEYTANGISEAEAEELLKQHIARFENELYKFMDRVGITLSQQQFDALLLFSYNCGSSWTYQPNTTIYKAVAAGDTGNLLIDGLTRWCNAGGQIKTYLLRRRQSEANIYLNGIYAQAQPEGYGYVLYDANGGVSSQVVQGFDVKLTSTVIPVPTYEGYTFEGWFTEPTGGKKVEILDSAVRNARLYAHWKDANGNAPEVQAPAGVKITVTGTNVNVRTGPGTGYSKAGTVNKGEQIYVTETADGNGYTWGKFTGGWIALKYTDYETASQPAPAPEQTTPEATVPETTTPEQEPETPADPEKGTVKVSSRLKIRTGPSTAYGVAGYYYNGDKVEILEQKLAGSMLWGKTAKGWISMEYVALENAQEEPKPEPQPQPQPQPQPEQTTSRTGTVNVTSLLRIRSNPSTTSSVVGYLSPKQKVTITQQQTSGSMTWGKVSKGWVSMDYIDLDPTGDNSGTTSSGNSEPAPQTVTGTVNVSSQLRIRAGAGTSYAVTGYLYNQEKVTVTEQKTVNGTTWGKVSKGWISMDYVTVDGASAPSQSQNQPQENTGTTRTITADCLKVRADAATSAKVVSYLKKGTKVQILETKTVGNLEWGRTPKGWISLKYTK